MTEQEASWEYSRAIDIIRRIKTEETHERYIDRHKAFDMAIKALEEIQQYRALGTVEELRVARDKQVAKEHYHTRIDRIDDCVRVSICPVCLGVIYTYQEEYPKYCSNCGQKLDWGNEDDNH